MTQNNLYMEDDNLRLYVDVQPIFIDELENSKNAAASSAAQAAQSEQNARTWKNDIIDYKTSLELFYAQSMNSLNDWYNSASSELTNLKNSCLQSIQSLSNSVLTSINNLYQQITSSIQTLGQSYVNQAHDYAELAQSTVDYRMSIDHLNQSKGLETGSLSTDKDVLPEIQKYKTSTFDRSKFTVVGSPVITSDGIASGFSDSNYLTTSLNFYGAKTFLIKIPFKTSSNFSSLQRVIDRSSGNNFIILEILTNKTCRVMAQTASVDLTFTATVSNALIENTEYMLEFSYGNGQYNAEVKNCANSTIVYSASAVSSNVWSNETVTHYIGRGKNTDNSFTGSIDLKQFSITVDGVPVFSGNKTGIDTVKPDDYTVVGTPTISADGVAGVFSNANYLTMPTIDVSKPFELEVKIKLEEYPSEGQAIVAFMVDGTSNGRFGLLFAVNNLGKLMFNTSSNGTSFIGEAVGTTTLSLNTWYYAKLIYNGSAFTSYLSSDGINYNQEATSTRDAVYNSLGAYRIGKYHDNAQWYFRGYIDLNSFKIYVDGNLAYQPCLKIPYTESKTGSKIVDSIYRDRVNDMAELFGYANYYTLGENDFTLPMGEIYGMIENLRKLIIQRTS